MTVPQIYVGIDPGNTTGIGVLNETGNFRGYELRFPECVNTIEQIIKRHLGVGRVMLAVERFDILPQTIRAGSDARRALGITCCVEWLATQYLTRYREFGRADTKKFCPDDHLQKLGWYLPGMGGHSNDAARVITLALATCDPSRWKHMVVTSGLLREE